MCQIMLKSYISILSVGSDETAKTAHVRDILGIRDTWINFRDMGIQCFLKGYICRIFWGYGIFFKIIIGIWDTGAPFQGLLINLLPFNPSWPCQRVSSLQYLGMLSGISSGSALNFKDRNYTSQLYKNNSWADPKRVTVCRDPPPLKSHKNIIRDS